MPSVRRTGYSPKDFSITMHRAIILLVILYGCGTWSLTWMEERRLRLFENMVLRRIFGPTKEDLTGN
jgi:hypothetical protein